MIDSGHHKMENESITSRNSKDYTLKHKSAKLKIVIIINLHFNN